jgi:hypothetical protein
MKKMQITYFFISLFFMCTSLSYAEHEEYGLGAIPSLLPKEQVELEGAFLSSFPEQFDWRDGGWVTPVKHQGQCGSCWAFGALAAMEAQIRIQLNNPNYVIDLSEQDLVSCFNAGNGWGGCRGQYLDVTCNYLKSGSGITDEQCFPYVAYEVNCTNKCSNGAVYKLRSWNFLPCAYTHKVRWRYSNGATDFYQLDIPSVQTIKGAVSQGPVLCALAVYNDFYSYYGGVYEPGSGVYFEGLHAITIVGWDDSDRSWICKNSWGTGWGNSGYFKIRWIEDNVDDWSTGGSNDSTIIGYDAIQMVAGVEEPETTTTTTVQPYPECCLDFTLLEGLAEEPSKIYLFFSVTNCEGEPKSNLTADDFEIYENNDYISKYESDQTILPAPKLYTMSTVLILDTSGSILASETLDSLKLSAKTFVDNVAGKDAQEVAIYLFDGREDIKELVSYTRDVSTLKNAIESLSREGIMSDPEYDNSTNLNGAVQKGLSILDQRRSGIESEQLFTGTLVTFTDGTDQAARVSDSDAVNSVKSSDHASFTIGLGGEIDESHLNDLGKDGFVWAENIGDLEEAFTEIANEIERESKKYYVLGYCSPKRAGNHSVTLKVTGCEGSLSYSFNADHFGPGCDVSEIMSIVNDQVTTCLSVEPGSATVGDDEDITITAENSNFVDGLTEVVFGCSGVTVDSAEVISATEVVAHIDIADSVIQGMCGVKVITGEERVTCEDAFVVEEGGSLYIRGRIIGNTGVYVEGLSGVKVVLHGADDDFIDSTITGGYGEFKFSGLNSKSYSIQVEDSRKYNPEKYELYLEEAVEDLVFEREKTTCALISMYGEDSEEVKLLRKFRDEVLSDTPEGQKIIKLYYGWSPVIVNMMKGDESLKDEIKSMINGILPLIREEVLL